jgi:hypothetical protein
MPAAESLNIAVPRLSAEDYPEFCRVCAGLPPMYQEWQFNQRQYHRHRRRFGYKLVSIPIGPAEFEGYCGHEHCAATVDALYCLAQEKMAVRPGRSRQRNIVGAVACDSGSGAHGARIPRTC